MNTNDSSRLIDENEIRAAVRYFDFDREAFSRDVLERVQRGSQEQTSVTRVNRLEPKSNHFRDGLLRIAASVVPFTLLGGSSASAQSSVPQSNAIPSTLAALGGVKKTFALVAMPAMSLLMIAVTIVSLFRIRKSQLTATTVDADVMQIREAINGWWRQHGLVAGIIFALALAAPFFGWTSALLIVFIASALAATSLIVKLGKSGMVDRTSVALGCIPVLAILGLISNGFETTNSVALFDPMLVSVTCFAGAGILAFFTSPFAFNGSKPWVNRLRRIALIAVCVVFVVFGTKTIWKPITTKSMVQYVENFDPDWVGQWQTWEVTADWLNDQEIQWDRTGVRNRFLATADNEEHKRYLLGTAISTGLMSPSELVKNDDVLAIGQRLLDQGTVNQPITSISQLAFAIEVLADAGDLSPAEKDHLVRRLMATWNAIEKAPKDAVVLEEADIITRLFGKLDQSPELAKRKTDVHRWLGQYQLTNTSVFTPSGGFLKYPSVRCSDASATESAVRLMQHYGGSENIDVLALRSFLRPKTDWGLLTHSEMVRASTLQRLDQVPAISQPTAWDYLVRNQSLWFAMMLVGLCIYATLGAPNLIKQD